jgi:hypothetical protein
MPGSHGRRRNGSSAEPVLLSPTEVAALRADALAKARHLHRKYPNSRARILGDDTPDAPVLRDSLARPDIAPAGPNLFNLFSPEEYAEFQRAASDQLSPEEIEALRADAVAKMWYLKRTKYPGLKILGEPPPEVEAMQSSATKPDMPKAAPVRWSLRGIATLVADRLARLRQRQLNCWRARR